MVKHIHTLAFRAMQANQQMIAHLTRVQYGFLQDKHVAQAHETLQTIQVLLHEMQTALHAPPDSSSKVVPMK